MTDLHLEDKLAGLKQLLALTKEEIEILRREVKYLGEVFARVGVGQGSAKNWQRSWRERRRT